MLDKTHSIKFKQNYDVISAAIAKKQKNDVVGLLRREGIYDDVSENKVIFLGFFDLIHVYVL